jgi:hypothetical protein
VKFITIYLTNIPADCVKILALRLIITKVEIMRNIEGGAKQLNRKGVNNSFTKQNITKQTRAMIPTDRTY